MFKTALLTFFFSCFCLSANISGAHRSVSHPQKNVTAITNGIGGLTIDEFLAVTPKTIKEKTGRRLTWKETIVLKKAQKKILKEVEAAQTYNSGKDQDTALLLAIFLGFVGAHRFYLGHTAAGFIQLMTFGGCGIWALIDMIMIATGDLQPIDGPYDETLD